MIILDSNVWIAFFNLEDSQHNQAKKVLSSVSQELIIPEYIVIEVCTVLSQKASKQTTIKFLDFIFDNEDIQVLYSGVKFFHHTLKLYMKSSDNKLSFIDTSLLLLSSRYTVITFDKKLHKELVK